MTINEEKEKRLPSLLMFGGLLILLLSLFGCTIRGDGSAKEVKNEIITDDDLLLEVNKMLPEFGGMFYDESGYLNIIIVNLDSTLEKDRSSTLAIDKKVRDVETVINKVYGEEHLKTGSGIETTSIKEEKRTLDKPTIKLRSGSYTLRQLMQWRSSTIGLLKNKNVVFSDLDEAKNKVTIGVLDEKTKKELYRYFKKKSIPNNAINIEIAKPIIEFKSLKSTIRPVVGGLQISRSYVGDCTLGVNAYWRTHPQSDNWLKGFITNSHCSKRFGSVDTHRIYQSSRTLDSIQKNYIGYEIADPPFWTCWVIYDCRYSDAAFVRYVGTNWTLGKIAKPLTSNSGTIEIDPVLPAFNIVAEKHNPIAGEFLHKVGMTTGWTWGRVTKTCVDENSESGVRLFCQHVVSTFGRDYRIVWKGDSGAPVFRRHGSFRNPNVTFYGLLWGGPEGGREFHFSSIKYIKKELNDLRIAVGSEPPEYQPPPRPSCPSGQKCCSISPGGKCVCVPNNQNCPTTTPLGGCQTGEVCCEPGAGSCKLCAAPGECPDIR